MKLLDKLILFRLKKHKEKYDELFLNIHYHERGIKNVLDTLKHFEIINEIDCEQTLYNNIITSIYEKWGKLIEEKERMRERIDCLTIELNAYKNSYTNYDEIIKINNELRKFIDNNIKT